MPCERCNKTQEAVKALQATVRELEARVAQLEAVSTGAVIALREGADTLKRMESVPVGHIVQQAISQQ